MKYRYNTGWTELDERYIPLNGVALLLIEQCQRMGINDELLFRKIKVSPSDIDAGYKISPLQLSYLYENAFKINHGNDFRFIISDYVFHYCDPVLRNALNNAACLRELLLLAEDYIQEVFPLHHLRIRKTDQHWYLFFDRVFQEPSDLGIEAVIQEHLFASLLALIRSLISVPLQMELCFTHSPISDELTYKGYFKNLSLTFNATLNMLKLSTEDLEQPVNMASPVLFKAALQQYTPASRQGFVQLVRTEVQHQLTSVPTQEEFADTLSMSAATLKRKLKQHSTTYRQLVDSLRYEESCFLREVCKLDDNEIARQLGYFDVSNFRRSLRRWLA
jgi:AraC-like DNA-binding protein